MKCVDFIEALYEGESFEACIRHYGQCPDCREKYRAEYEMEVALRGLNRDCRNYDLSNSVRKEIRNRQIRARELSAARLVVWLIIGIAIAFFVISVIPFVSGWRNIAQEGLKSAESSGNLLSAINSRIHQAANRILSMEINKELIGFLLVMCGLSLTALFIQSKEFLVRLRVRLNR